MILPFILATAFPAEPVPLIEITHQAAALPAGATFDLSAMPLWVQLLLPVLAYALFSGLVGGLNEVIRKRDADGVPVSSTLRLASAVLNAMAANLDKAAQQSAKAKEPAP